MDGVYGAIADNDWLRQSEREAWSRRLRQLRQELAQGQAQLSPPEPVSSEQLRRERKSVCSIALWSLRTAVAIFRRTQLTLCFLEKL